MFDASEFAVIMLDLERISRVSAENFFAIACSQYDLTMNQLHILMELNKDQCYTVGELSHVVGILRGNMAGVCKKLEAQDLIERIRSQDDERVIHLQITENGKILIREILQQIQQKYHAILQQALPEDCEKILDGLKALYALLERM